MSASAALLPCPVCSHNVFETSESLRDRLIFVSTNKIPCPICQLEVTGIDKLTIHLFSHVKVLPVQASNSSNETSKEGKKNKEECQAIQQNKKPKSGAIKNKQIVTTNAPVKFVKIYPKLPVISVNTVPVLDMTRTSIEDGVNVRNSLYLPTLKPEAALQPNTICNLCGLQFVDANILKVHRCLIHNIDENVNTTVTKYQCHVCPKSFKMRGSLMVHMRVAHFGFMSAETKEANDKSIPDDNNEHEKLPEVERNDNKQWQCDVCRKSFTTKYFLKKHKRLHTGETPYACGQCNKTFTFQQSYHKHLLYHNDEKPHVCSYCGRGFKELSTLHNHQRIHTGEKPFSCESCGKCFRQRVSYLVHRRIHTGAMPYKCTACNKSFRYKVSQRTHKCQVQPPGTVIRKTGELVEKLKRKQSDIKTTSNGDLNGNITKIFPPDISESSAELVRTGARLSLEDTENDDFVLIKLSHNDNNVNEESNAHKDTEVDFQNHDEISFANAIDSLMESVPSEDKNVPSPSEILKNLCLSPEDDDSKQENTVGLNYHQILDDFNEFLQ